MSETGSNARIPRTNATFCETVDRGQLRRSFWDFAGR